MVRKNHSSRLVKIQFYAITAEIYEVGQDDFDTGIAEIDAVEQLFDNAIKLVMDPGGTGDFTVGEEIVGDEFLQSHNNYYR
ncbi:MAG: hypothetical protein CM15mV3_0750 [Caudoviricetes sp.]|nr:MAG: hypothetical protein CM15mV3_0750 [Caudoviricetes sp.]